MDCSNIGQFNDFVEENIIERINQIDFSNENYETIMKIKNNLPKLFINQKILDSIEQFQNEFKALSDYEKKSWLDCDFKWYCGFINKKNAISFGHLHSIDNVVRMNYM